MSKRFKLAILTFVSAFAVSALGASSASGPRTMTADEIKAAVNAYLIESLDAAPERGGNDDDCDRPGDTRACADAACAKLGPWGCDAQDEMTKVLRACRGNRGGGCLTTACAKLGPWGCDDMAEVEQVAIACQHNAGGACVERACAKLGPWGCDEMFEVIPVASACAGQYDGGACMEAACARLGRFGCDEMPEVLQVLNECGGH